MIYHETLDNFSVRWSHESKQQMTCIYNSVTSNLMYLKAIVVDLLVFGGIVAQTWLLSCL